MRYFPCQRKDSARHLVDRQETATALSDTPTKTVTLPKNTIKQGRFTPKE